MTETSSTPPASARETSRLHSAAVVLASLIIPLPVVAGRVVEGALDTINPADVDVAAGLAYLREILGWSFGVLGVLLVAIVAVFVVIYRRTRTLDALKLPLLIAVVQVVLGVIALGFNGLIQSAEG